MQLTVSASQAKVILVPANVVSNIKGFFGKAFDSIKKGADSVIHSKFVQAVKNRYTKKVSTKLIDIYKRHPESNW